LGVRRVVLGSVLVLALGGCLEDIETETPLTMAPGLYEVELPGVALAGFDIDRPDEPTKTLCLRPGDGDYFAHRVLRESLLVQGCDDPVNRRRGNLLETTIRCEAKNVEAGGELVLRGRGRIREDRFAAEFKLDLTELEIDNPEDRQGAQMLQALQSVGGVSLDARRVGECPA
jgi:hypothetical protein